MKQVIQITGLVALAMIGVSCIPPASNPSVNTTQSAYPIPTSQYATPSSFDSTIVTNQKQIFTDPNGWFSINIPSEWKPKTKNSFSGGNGFFEIGYLPDKMFMQSALDVCQWLANIDSQSTHAVSWFFLENNSIGCTVYPLADSKTTQSIIEIPTTDPSEKFLFIKTDPEHHDEIIISFAWLRPVDPYEKFLFPQTPLRAEDASFWENTSGVPPALVLTQYALSEDGQDERPAQKRFFEFLPPNVPKKEGNSGTVWFSDTLEETNEKLKPFGYELKPSSPDHLQDLFKDDKMVINNIYKKSDIHRFASENGEMIAFVVYAVKDPNQSYLAPYNSISYLIQNDTILGHKDGIENPMSPTLPPVLYKEELLWLQAAENVHVEVQTSNQTAVFSFATYYGAKLPVNGFTAWDDHWILEIGNFMIQDGEIINEKFGFEEAFDWGLLNDKPFYFFRKGPRVGMSYDGKFLPFYYDYVVHGFCCGLALNNPSWEEDDVRFFAQKDGVWYYVIVETE